MKDDDPKVATPPFAPDASHATEEVARAEPPPEVVASAPPNLTEFTPSTSGTASPLLLQHVSVFCLLVLSGARQRSRWE